jgi:hypothetical protein
MRIHRTNPPASKLAYGFAADPPSVSAIAKRGGIVSWFEVAAQVEPHLRRNEYEQCERIISSALASYPKSPFHKVLELEFLNSVDDIAENFNEFFKRESARFNVAAIYAETNGFYINPDDDSLTSLHTTPMVAWTILIGFPIGNPKIGLA